MERAAQVVVDERLGLFLSGVVVGRGKLGVAEQKGEPLGHLDVAVTRLALHGAVQEGDAEREVDHGVRRAQGVRAQIVDY